MWCLQNCLYEYSLLLVPWWAYFYQHLGELEDDIKFRIKHIPVTPTTDIKLGYWSLFSKKRLCVINSVYRPKSWNVVEVSSFSSFMSPNHLQLLSLIWWLSASFANIGSIRISSNLAFTSGFVGSCLYPSTFCLWAAWTFQHWKQSMVWHCSH